MIFPTKLHTLIADALLQTEYMTAKELFNAVIQDGSLSLSQFYNILKHLSQAMIIHKKWTCFSLHPHRITRCQQYTHLLSKRAILQKESFTKWYYKKIDCSTLADASTVRAEYVTRLLEVTGEKNHYEYISRNYFLLSNLSTFSNFPFEYTQYGHQTRVVCGGSTFLDTYALSLHALQNFQMVFSDRIPQEQQRFEIVVIGDFLIQTFPSEFLVSCINKLFETVSSIEQLDYQFYCSLFQVKSQCHLLVLHNPENAKYRRHTIRMLHGLPTQ